MPKDKTRDSAVMILKIALWILSAVLLWSAFKDIDIKLDKILEIHDAK